MISIDRQVSSREASLTSWPNGWAEEMAPEYPQASCYRARYYDPAAGRFLIEDPIGFSGGEDFYDYVNNDSTDLTDPSGLQPGSYTRKYKCDLLGNCTRMHPLGGKTYKPPKQQPCPLVTKDFDDFNHCFDNTFPNNLPGAMGKQLAGKQYSQPLPGNPNAEPQIPGVGLGDVVNTVGEAAEHAILECLKEHPLAPLDPRFPPGLNVGKMASPNWWDGVSNFLGFSSPIF